VQDEMKQSLNSNTCKFQKIILSFDVYQKCKINSNEIKINDKLYDIKSIKTSGSNIELLVMNDSKEENILAKIAEFTNNVPHSNNAIANNLKQLLSLNYIPLEANNGSFIYPSTVVKILFSITSVISNFPEIPTPPPRLA
jgi:hypothetical protein